MQSFLNDKENELNYATQLYNSGYLQGPNKCKCRNTFFNIQKDSYNSTSGCCFRFMNYKCRLKYSIRTNSIFSFFLSLKCRLYMKLSIIL